jgi:hypothetical protein
MTATAYGMWMLRLQREKEDLLLAEQAEITESKEAKVEIREIAVKRVATTA